MEEEERLRGEEERKDWGKLLGNSERGTLIGPERWTRQASQPEGRTAREQGPASQVDFAVCRQSDRVI